MLGNPYIPLIPDSPFQRAERDQTVKITRTMTSSLVSEGISLICWIEICVWYVSAIVTITTTKELMLQFQFPYLLCTSQFLFASALSNIYMIVTKRHKPALADLRYMLNSVSATYTLGFVFTNIAFSLGNIT